MMNATRNVSIDCIFNEAIKLKSNCQITETFSLPSLDDVLLIYLNLQNFRNAIKTKEDCHNLNTSKNNDGAYKNENNAQNLHPIYLRTHWTAHSYSEFHKLDFNKISTIQTIQVLGELRLWYCNNISNEIYFEPQSIIQIVVSKMFGSKRTGKLSLYTMEPLFKCRK